MGSFKTVSPFGVSTKRFATLGYHPGLDPHGTLRKTGGIGPGHYKVRDIDCPFKNKRNKERWTQKLELEEFSKYLGYKNAALLLHKNEEKKRFGPGHYDIIESVFKPSRHNKYENFSFGMSKRFKARVKHENPPPGNYGVPDRKLEKLNRPQHQWTPVPPFEWDNFVPRFRVKYKSWELPCNRYKIPKQGIASITQKEVSKRGPYDLFTGPRNETTIKGYFAPNAFKGANIWPRTLPSCMDNLLKSKNKHRTGRFFKADRFAGPKGLNVPGPNYYKLYPKRKFKQNVCPFNCSVISCRPTTSLELRPGPGRYESRAPKCVMKIPANMQQTWAFKCKTQRTQYKAVVYNDF